MCFILSFHILFLKKKNELEEIPSTKTGLYKNHSQFNLDYNIYIYIPLKIHSVRGFV